MYSTIDKGKFDGYNAHMKPAKTTLPNGIAILGPTASGKSALGIALAKAFSGEILSADSRQVYCGMDIGTAKESVADQQGVPHFGIDLINHDESYSLADFQTYAYKIIDAMLARESLPIVVGGSSLYVSAVVDGYVLPKAKPDAELRAELEQCSVEELASQLQQVDPGALAALGGHNKRFLIRAIEIAQQTQQDVQAQKTHGPKYSFLKLGVAIERDVLYERINARVGAMMQAGLVEETQQLRKQYPHNLPSMSSIGYAEIGAMLDGEISQEEAVEKIKQRTRHYAKRQLTWWRKDKDIVWVADHAEAIAAVTAFL